MRYAPLLGLLLALAGCGSDKPKTTAADSGADTKPDASPGGRADAGAPKDAGSGKLDSAAGKLDRPSILPRPPSTGLPAELRPPR